MFPHRVPIALQQVPIEIANGASERLQKLALVRKALDLLRKTHLLTLQPVSALVIRL